MFSGDFVRLTTTGGSGYYEGGGSGDDDDQELLLLESVRMALTAERVSLDIAC
jgi:hypothetical protein